MYLQLDSQEFDSQSLRLRGWRWHSFAEEPEGKKTINLRSIYRSPNAAPLWQLVCLPLVCGILIYLTYSQKPFVVPDLPFLFRNCPLALGKLELPFLKSIDCSIIVALTILPISAALS